MKPVARLSEWLRIRMPRTYLFARRFRRPRPYDLAARELGERLGWAVHSGPFAGMRCLKESWGSSFMPKLLGSYEMELHPWLIEIVAGRPRLVVDIGCAEGYYAVGLARAVPQCHVIAYDLDPTAREMCRRMARLNAVAVDVREGCRRDQLKDLADAVLVVDCEGAELDLLRPEGLARATILVELHDYLRPGLTRELLARFEPTHTIELRAVEDRDPGRFAVLADLAPERRALAVDEHRILEGARIRQQWALLRPR